MAINNFILAFIPGSEFTSYASFFMRSGGNEGAGVVRILLELNSYLLTIEIKFVRICALGAGPSQPRLIARPPLGQRIVIALRAAGDQ